LTEQSSGHGEQRDSARAAYGQSGQPSYSGEPTNAAANQAAGDNTYSVPRQREHQQAAKGWLATLFDFKFTSFITLKIVKVLYPLFMILTALIALAFTVLVFRLNAALGFLTLIFGVPVYFLWITVLSRIFLESVVVFFRISEDILTIRERGDVR
jgi:lipopolysaccharide export LptBFGC system permease protein LptF